MPTSPKLPHERCHGEVSGKSATCHGEVADMDYVMGKSWGSFGVSNHRYMSRWFEKIPRLPVCVILMEFGNKHNDITNGLSHFAACQAVRRPVTH